MRAPGWRPVLVGDDAARAIAIATEIAAVLTRAPAPDVLGDRAALTDGLPGWALLLARLDGLRPGQGHAEAAARLLDEAVRESAAVAGSQYLFGGVTGLAWALQHLAPLARPAHVEALADIDDAILGGLAGEPHAVDFDLISGLVGLGVLAAERAIVAGDAAPRARAVLERVVQWLDAGAEPVDDGFAWRTPAWTLDASMRAARPNGCHYTGVAHGTAGVLGLLATAARLGVAPVIARRLLEGGARWLIAQEMATGQALFPLYEMDAHERRAARSAWCTGAPGISLMLWRAAHAAGDAALARRAHGMARAASQMPPDETGVRDACLCHGAAGLGHLYGRWFAATGDERLRDAAVAWLRRAMDDCRPGEGVAGYATMNVPQNRRDPHPGLLLGAAGVGLALTTAVGEAAPDWDRVLLLSGPDNGGATVDIGGGGI